MDANDDSRRLSPEAFLVVDEFVRRLYQMSRAELENDRLARGFMGTDLTLIASLLQRSRPYIMADMDRFYSGSNYTGN